MAASVKSMTIVAGLLFFSATVHGLPAAYQRAARHAGVPPELLFVVAQQESGITRHNRLIPWPWTLNVAGKAQRFRSYTASCRGLHQALKRTSAKRIDAGLAQLNVGWQSHRVTHPCQLLDPYRNLALAAAILKEQRRPGEGWLLAAGRYHHPAGGKTASRYRRGVQRHLQNLPLSGQEPSL